MAKTVAKTPAKPTTKSSKTTTKPVRDIYQEVTDKIIASLEAGVRPWVKPWNPTGGKTGNRPLRATGQPYQGINVILLWMEADLQGFKSSVWMTYQQAAAQGGQVRKGEKGTTVVYANAFTKKETGDDGVERERRIPFLKAYTVFNTDQIDGLKLGEVVEVPATVLEENERLDHAEAFFSAIGGDVRHGGNQAFYRPSQDYIQMPLFEAFQEPLGYYSTLGHEYIHWTRAKDRLNRDYGQTRFADTGYAREELVAELGAAFLCADLNLAVEPRADHASYIDSWLKVLKEDKRAIVSAASAATRAVTFLSEKAGVTATEETVNQELDEAA